MWLYTRLQAAASEDVAAEYNEVLKQYKPQQIGLSGCSARGLLTAMSIAWFQKEHPPSPAAIGVFCASIGNIFGDDAAYLASPLKGTPAPKPGAADHSDKSSGTGYLSDADPNDPLAYPTNSPALAAKFPPSFLVTSTHARHLGMVIQPHIELVKAGIDADLRVSDGLPHAFRSNSDLPESREVCNTTANFFNRHLSPMKTVSC